MKKSDIIEIGAVVVGSIIIGYNIIFNKKCKVCGQKLEKGEIKKIFPKDYIGESIKYNKFYIKHYNINPEYLCREMKLCDKCYMAVKKQLDLIKADERLYKSEKNIIETFPKTYQGKIPDCKEVEIYSTEFYDWKEDALEEIKKYASLKRKDLVYEIIYICEKITEANGYIHTIWQANGKIAKKRQNFN